MDSLRSVAEESQGYCYIEWSLGVGWGRRKDKDRVKKQKIREQYTVTIVTELQIQQQCHEQIVFGQYRNACW